ncbi:histidine kinase [Yinghuangia sp. ASG 101]|uniref:sensor histidine kinase n=1 Tax=Yinghuangia sp. ASG 101 TaxID=2896848 RepID=UPI001E4C6994|nr:histidine kinase [Yinghuangia sp. ASG 101]UGQ10380.1 histidine kinase [Yinghuangia sp. ASG 101]
MARGRPHRHDVMIAAAGLVSGIVLLLVGVIADYTGLPLAWTLVPLTAMTVAEVLRRAAQKTALVIAFAALIADQFLGSNIATIVMFTDVVYAATLYGPVRQARRLASVSVFATVVAAVAGVGLARDAKGLIVGVFAGLVTLMPWWTGWTIRTHRDEAAAERLRAEQTALLAELDRRSAVEQERARMARELHDVVANHLSAIAIHSTAAMSVAKGDPEATARALAVIRESSVQGLAEMRRLIGLLRGTGGGGGGEAAPGDREGAEAAVPRLDSLDALVARASRSGADNGLRCTLDDRRPGGEQVPAPVELAAFRIVQESLTNALKHAAPGTVTVRLESSATALLVGVESPYAPAPGGPRAPGAGAGLVGMRERASLLGGTFAAGPSPGEGMWRVRAELPLCDAEG